MDLAPADLEQPPIAGGLPLLEPPAELDHRALAIRRAARSLIVSSSPSLALARHWLDMPPANNGSGFPEPYPTLQDAVSAILADPLDVVAIGICRTFPFAKILSLVGRPRRFGFVRQAEAVKARFGVASPIETATFTGDALRRIAGRIAAGR